MKETIKLGIIGLGNRGKNMSRNIFGDMRDVEITMVCDMVSEKVKDTQKYFEEEVEKVNERSAPYKAVGCVKLRTEEFAKNTSRKIVRFAIDKSID